MEVEFSLIPEDFVAARSHYYRPHRKQLIFIHLALLILEGVALLLGVGFAQRVKQAGLLPALITVVILLSIPQLLFLVLYLNRKRIAVSQISRFLRQGKNAKLLEPRKLTISPDGISESSADSAGITVWTGIEKIAATEEHAFFYKSTERPIILPRRPFASDQNFRHFVETAQGYFEAANKEFEAANKELEPA